MERTKVLRGAHEVLHYTFDAGLNSRRWKTCGYYLFALTSTAGSQSLLGTILWSFHELFRSSPRARRSSNIVTNIEHWICKSTHLYRLFMKIDPTVDWLLLGVRHALPSVFIRWHFGHPAWHVHSDEMPTKRPSPSATMWGRLLRKQRPLGQQQEPWY